MSPKTSAILTLLFFLLFPAGGLFVSWMVAQNNIFNSARPFAVQAANDILATGTVKRLDDYGTLAFRQSPEEKKFEAAVASLGKFKSLSELKQGRWWADDSDGTTFQYAQMTGTAVYERGEAELKLVAARRTMAPEWRIESFQLKPR